MRGYANKATGPAALHKAAGTALAKHARKKAAAAKRAATRAKRAAKKAAKKAAKTHTKGAKKAAKKARTKAKVASKKATKAKASAKKAAKAKPKKKRAKKRGKRKVKGAGKAFKTKFEVGRKKVVVKAPPGTTVVERATVRKDTKGHKHVKVKFAAIGGRHITKLPTRG